MKAAEASMIGNGEGGVWTQCFYSLFSILFSTPSKYFSHFQRKHKIKKNKEALKVAVVYTSPHCLFLFVCFVFKILFIWQR